MGKLLSASLLVGGLAIIYGLLQAVPPRVPDAEDAAVVPVQVPLDAEAQAAPERLATALTFPTVCARDAANHVGDPAPFQQLHQHLERSFPLVYDKLEHERVNEWSLLFTWRGSNPELRPIIALSHLDVVPAPTEGPSYNWTHPPFSGTIANGAIWGRGALDVKSSLMQQLEAVALLLRQGYSPTRTIYLAFGHDEEVGGERGAGSIAQLLRSRGVELELVLDEGGVVMMDGVQGPTLTLVDQPVALVGTAEKGYETWEVEVQGTGGHSMMPPVDGSSVAGRISRILAALDAQPTTTKLAPPASDWLMGLAPAVKLAPVRMLLQNANNWVVNPILGQLMGQLSREISPFVRTTASVVKVQAGGIAENILPSSGSITINFRLLPGHDTSTIQAYLQLITRKEAPFVMLRRVGEGVPAAPVAPSSGPHWQLIKQAILETLQTERGLRVVPYLVQGLTDSRYYVPLAGGRVYRFCPHLVTLQSLKLIHNVDERMAVDDYLRGIGFYHRMFQLVSTDEGSEEAVAAAAAREAAAAE